MLTGALNNITTASKQTWDHVYRSTMVRLVTFCIMAVDIRLLRCQAREGSLPSLFLFFLSSPSVSFLLSPAFSVHVLSLFLLLSPLRCFSPFFLATPSPHPIRWSLGWSPVRNYLPGGRCPTLKQLACWHRACWSALDLSAPTEVLSVPAVLSSLSK